MLLNSSISWRNSAISFLLGLLQVLSIILFFLSPSTNPKLHKLLSYFSFCYVTLPKYVLTGVTVCVVLLEESG